MRVARLEKSSDWKSNRNLNEVALELIQKRYKSLNRVLSKQGIEMKKPIPRAGNIFFYVEGVQGVLEVMESRVKENEFTVDHKVAGAGVVSSWTIDVNEFMTSNTDSPNTYELKDWMIDQPKVFGKLLKSGLEMRIARLERQATRKVAGHIILAGNVNVRQLTRDLEDTFGVEDIELEDGVLTFLMSSMDNRNIEKQIKALAKKHDVKFEKGDFTDGLGMIYTKKATRRNR